jgi:cyanophycinase
MRPRAAGSLTHVSRRGPLILIGGGERTDDEATVLRLVVRRSGGRDAVLCVCTAASEAPDEAAARYREVFSRLGAREVVVLHLDGRREAFRTASLRAVARASGLFFTGGDQLRLTALLGGTPLEALLRRRFFAGLLAVAGTSAGASSVSSTMIVGGDAEEAPKMNTIRMAPGLGLLSGVVVDQHFAQRGRIGRLLAALAQNPGPLGLGLDEDTAVEVDARGAFHVLGSQTATILDARHIRFTNASESTPAQPLALAGVLLHVLPAGHGFDPVLRRPVAPGETEPVDRPRLRENEKGKLRWRSGR